MSLVTLNTWQKFPVEYLIKSCTDQKGIYLYHYMGTGKTWTSLSLIQHYGNDVVIIAPKSLHTQWTNDYFHKYAEYLPKLKHIVDYENLTSFLQEKRDYLPHETSLIIDEAHNLVNWLQSGNFPFYNYLKAFKKIIVLTATPFYSGQNDIANIINLLSETSVLPVDKNMFMKQYGSLRKTKSIIKGYTLPLIRNLSQLFLFYINSTWLINLTKFSLKKKDKTRYPNEKLVEGETVIDLMKECYKYLIKLYSSPNERLVKGEIVIDLMKECYNYLIKLYSSPIQKTLEHVFVSKFGTEFVKNNLEDIPESSGEKLFNDVSTYQLSEVKFYFIMLRLNLQRFFIDTSELTELHSCKSYIDYNNWVTKENKKKEESIAKKWHLFPIVEQSTKEYGLNKSAFIFLSIAVILSTILIYIWATTNWLENLYSNDLDYYDINYIKLANNVAPYISYYTINNHSKYSFSKKEKSLFPTVKNRTIYVSYSSIELDMFIRYTSGNMSFEDYYHLNIVKNNVDSGSYGLDQTNKELFLTNGRFLGNVCIFKLHKENMIQYSSKTLSYYLSGENSFSHVGSKFVRLQELIRKIPNHENIVIYSNSSLFSSYLSAYMNTQNIKHFYLRNITQSEEKQNIFTQFYDKLNNINILIIDSDYYEGLSILGVSHFIILEPTENVSKSQQLDARVVRINSHKPGQTVQIYKMCSSINFLKKLSSSYRNWIKQNLETFWSAVTTHHSRSLTPDYILLQRMENMMKCNTNLQKAISSKSIESFVSKRQYPKSCNFDKNKSVSIYEPTDNYFKNKYSNRNHSEMHNVQSKRKQSTNIKFSKKK